MPRADSDMPRLELYLLGRLQLEREGRAVILRRRKALLLLAYLALEQGPHPREKLAALLWGDSTDAQARLSLRVALADLRKATHPDLFLADADTLAWNPALALWTDTTAWRETARRIRELPINVAPHALGEAQHALETLYRGELLPGFYDAWVLEWRERFQTQYIDLLLHLTHLWRAAGEYGRAIAAAQRVLAFDPANEIAHQHLIFGFAAQGDRPAALAQYETAVRLLQAELGVEPSAETHALVARIRREPSGVSLAAPLTNLPKPATSFVGRRREMQEVTGLLHKGKLVTLTGAGGSGKTRLAIQVSWDLTDEYADGVWWVELASLTEEALVPHALAKILGVQPESNTGAPVEQRLENYLRERRALIVLDNCEHLRTACARLVVALVEACTGVVLLASSREPLGVAGERVYAVPALPVPAESALAPAPPGDTAVTELMEYAAVRLLVERAGDVRPAFTLTAQSAAAVVQICRVLEGIPLALEIAAAQLRDMDVHELRTRLDERLRWAGAGSAVPDRQQTLNALFDWSYERLEAGARTLFRRLAVLRGGFDLPAAVAVAYGAVDADAPRDELGTTAAHIVAQWLQLLVAKSLLGASAVAQGTRYEMPETLREYARAKLDAAGEAPAMQARHLAYFDGVVRTATEQLFSADQIQWLDLLEREHPNLRAALAHVQTTGDVETEVRMAGQLGPFWQLRNYWSEGRAWLGQALDRAGDLPPSAPLAKAYACGGVMAWLQGDYGQALAMHRRALDLYRYVEDPWGISNSLNNVALQAEALGDYAQAHRLYDEALALARELDHARLILRVLNNLCSIAYLRGELAAMQAFAVEALARARAFGDKYALAIALVNRAQAALAHGAFDDALALSTEALTVADELGNREFRAEGLRHQAMALLKRGDLAGAQAHFGESLQLAFDLGAKRQMTWSLEGLAQVAAAQNALPRAAQLLSAATALRSSIAIPKDATEQVEHAALAQSLRRALGEADFAREWAAGGALALERAVEVGLG